MMFVALFNAVASAFNLTIYLGHVHGATLANLGCGIFSGLVAIIFAVRSA